ncbi:MAG: S8 family serine peptidase [bacterium]
MIKPIQNHPRIAPLNTIVIFALILLVDYPLAASAQTAYWVFFRDRGTDVSASVYVDAHALERRKLRGVLEISGDFDRPVCREYLTEIQSFPGVRWRGESRWLNAVSIEADSATLSKLSQLPFVRRLQPVAKLVRAGNPDDFRNRASFVRKTVNERLLESVYTSDGRPTQPDPAVTDPYWRMDRAWYGPSLNQVRQINALETHFRGNHGTGVRIAVLDGGFILSHEAFQHLDVIAQYDFINDDDNTDYDASQDVWGQPDHGTACMSVIGAYLPGNLIGLAHEASFILCKTENDASETPVEEDFWVRAVEWAEALGADVLSSSLSYKDWYQLADYDGLTAPTSRAAQIARDLGMVLCTSVGNEGPDPMSLGVPADAEGVLAIGAVKYNGDLARFSSRGPAADGRIKPDICAQGVRTACVNPGTWVEYSFWNGTSLSCPVAAGGIALILAEHPDWGPDRIHEAVRETASRAARPDNDWGWGILNVEEAIHYPSVSGWVLDSSGRGLENVSVHLVGEQVDLNVTTDYSGFYRFPNLDFIRCQVEVLWKDGVVSKSEHLVVPPSEEVDLSEPQ